MRILFALRLTYHFWTHKGLSLLIILNTFCLGHFFKPERLTEVCCLVRILVHDHHRRSVPFWVWCISHFHHFTLDDSYKVSVVLSMQNFPSNSSSLWLRDSSHCLHLLSTQELLLTHRWIGISQDSGIAAFQQFNMTL